MFAVTCPSNPVKSPVIFGVSPPQSPVKEIVPAPVTVAAIS